MRTSATSLVRAASLSLALALAGCSLSSGLVPTQPAAIAQQLLIRSLERSLARLDTARFEAYTVDVDVFTQAGNEGFVREFTLAWLRGHGVRTSASSPSVRLKIFASVLGTDRGETLIGLPAFQAPVVNLPFPEIALFKWTRNRGHTELRAFSFDAATEEFIGQLPLAIGRSKADDFTVLLFIGFSVTDIDEPAR